ncbi:hypothetical protein FB451DRAFT_228189 [Mycena latifolia]|nr:hypothetical protein FB451DRAFT_228189 [Mycena latifolia]
MVFFLAAFLFSCFWSTAFPTRVAVGFFWGLVSMLIVWCLLWQSSESTDSTVAFSWSAWVKSAIKPDSESLELEAEVEDIRNPDTGGRRSGEIRMSTMKNKATEIAASPPLNIAEMVV